MISKLREHDRRTLTADGPKFDLEKVLEAGHSMLKLLIGRSAMRFPDDPAPTLELEPGQYAPLDDVALQEVMNLYREVSREAFDAADLMVFLSFGPYLATWAPLGISALFGPVGNCVTIYEEPWEDLDVTPLILLQSRHAPFQPMGRIATRFLAETLRQDPYGTGTDFIPNEGDADTVAIRFPHADFGAGAGRIRVCRYFDLDGPMPIDGEDP